MIQSFVPMLATSFVCVCVCGAVSAKPSSAPTGLQYTYSDGIIEATGQDNELLELISYARRSIGETNSSWAGDPLYQTIPMLYSGAEDGLLEGPTWEAYWTQNSYGTAMTCLPFLGDLAFKGMRESQNWWFNNMADGTQPYGGGTQGWAPDGCGCDDGTPTSCNYKQGDGNVPIHDVLYLFRWTLEETLSGVIMQSELLLISRNLSAIVEFLPKAARTSNLIEGRRDAATRMKTFLSGPSSNLLAPSFGGWQLDNGVHAWSYMTGISVTYSIALMKLIELCKLVDDNAGTTLYSQRLSLNLDGLDFFLAPEGDYFVRSVDPNGTKHGVLGQQKHGYFEASPNHDAVAFRVVDDLLAGKIVAKIKSLGALIRPNVFILPNTDATGKPSVTGSGAIGYDDMACGSGVQCGGIFEFGTWVNGGVWTTTEGRWLLAAARMGDLSPARASVKQMISLFASGWRMDNPLTNFGLNVYQPNEDINLTIDNFASAGGLLRGLFEYLYSATTLTLIPHLPDNITQYSQNFAVRWGPYRIKLSTNGVASTGISSISINGIQTKSGMHFHNSTTVVLSFAQLPPASPEALQAVNSSISTASTEVSVLITFKNQTMTSKPVSHEEIIPKISQHLRKRQQPLPAGIIGHFSARSMAPDQLSGGPVTLWPNLVSGGDPLKYPCPTSVNATGPTAPPMYINGSVPAVRFDGNATMLCASGSASALGSQKSFVAVFRPQTNSEIYCLVVGGTAGGFNGLAISPIATNGTYQAQVDIDWIGSTDQDRLSPTNVFDEITLATITYNTSVSQSFISGCSESIVNSNVASSSPLGFSTGCRDDGGYHRFYNGTLHELMVFNTSLSPGDRASVELYMASRWGINIPTYCPHKNINCTSLLTNPTGPSPALIKRLLSFVSATSILPLNETLAHTMATVTLGYVQSAEDRCNGLNNNTIPQLRNSAATQASVLQIWTSALSVATGLQNHIDNTLMRLPLDPIANALVKAWNATNKN